MRSLIAYLPALACGAMMLLICVPMMLGRKHDGSADGSATQEDVTELREEIARLKAERIPGGKSESING